MLPRSRTNRVKHPERASIRPNSGRWRGEDLLVAGAAALIQLAEIAALAVIGLLEAEGINIEAGEELDKWRSSRKRTPTTPISKKALDKFTSCQFIIYVDD